MQGYSEVKSPRALLLSHDGTMRAISEVSYFEETGEVLRTLIDRTTRVMLLPSRQNSTNDDVTSHTSEASLAP